MKKIEGTMIIEFTCSEEKDKSVIVRVQKLLHRASSSRCSLSVEREYKEKGLKRMRASTFINGLVGMGMGEKVFARSTRQ